jgi:hypothetical protein
LRTIKGGVGAFRTKEKAGDVEYLSILDAGEAESEEVLHEAERNFAIS